MKQISPINQIKLFGLNKYMNELIQLYENKKLPNKILLSGQKGLGKSTMIYHFINHVLSKDEEFCYDVGNFTINVENQSFKTILNKSNPNFILIDIESEKKSIDISQIRDLISNLNKSSFNKKPKFVLIDNIEFLNTSSINILLKVIEEPNDNVHFFLINNCKKILSTLISRCINFKISLSNKEILDTTNKLLNGQISDFINKELINYYSTPGSIYNLISFGKTYDYDIINLDLKNFLKIIIKDNQYKKSKHLNYLFFDLIESYFNKINSSLFSRVSDKYSFFLKRISNTKKFNLDDDSLFMEFEEKILNG